MAEQPVATSSYLARRAPISPISSADIYAQASPYFQLPSWFRSNPIQGQTYLTDESNQKLKEEYERQRLLMTSSPTAPAAYPGGTILHKGFYDLLALSTPVVETVSRFWTGAVNPYREEPLVASPPYEQIPAGAPPRVANIPVGQLPPPTVSPTSTPTKKGRRVSKDMIGKPTGFVHLVHASDAEQAEALLTRWGPSDPRWARPIKDYVRQQAQARAVAEVVGAMHPTLSQLQTIPGESTDDGRTKPIGPAPLRVVNGMSTPSSLTTTTVNTARATVESPVTGMPIRIEGLPSPRGGGWPIGSGPNALPTVLQRGAFGVVSLVKEKSTGQLFAMKQLRKTDMLRKGQEGHVRAEREVLKSAALVSSANAPEWIVRMHYSFQDRDNLYLVLEFMGGGDLLNLLIEKDVFEENFARFYIAEEIMRPPPQMVLAIESCHKQGFIHRDIKPDNFLFDPEGHIKLSDFGLATDLHWAHDTSYYEQQRKDLLKKHGIDLNDPNGIADGKKTKRMAPQEIERIMGGQEGEGGIFTWREKNRKKRHVTRQKILNWKQSLKFPPRPRVSREGVNLMERLLCEPEDRIGSEASSSVVRPNSLIMQERRSGFILPNVGKGKSVDGAEFIKAHPWFRGIDWTNIHRQAAPFKPNLSTPEDTRHFDDDIPPEPLAPANGAAPDATRDPLLKDKVYGDHILNVRKALAFQGFTHRSPRKMDYARIDTLYPDEPGHERGRDAARRGGTIGRGRALSM
ncbi:hypothetical protein FRC01_009686 [Tulasnella sp. 417]|nr:hypothetical protein FRC01_009686 [Tulasnella sp. 417]